MMDSLYDKQRKRFASMKKFSWILLIVMGLIPPMGLGTIAYVYSDQLGSKEVFLGNEMAKEARAYMGKPPIIEEEPQRPIRP
jgi:hypothetical protein